MSLALVAGNAAAALTTGTDLGSPGSVVFAIEDTVTNKTFFLDLALGGNTGLNYSSFVNKTGGATGNLSWDLGALGGSSFTSFAPNNASFNWSVVGGYGLGPAAENLTSATDPAGTQWGALSTGAGASVFAQQGFDRIQAETSFSGKIGAWPFWLSGPEGALDANVGSINPVGSDSFYSQHLADVGQLTDAPGAPSFKGPTAADFFWITNPDFADNNTIQKLGTFTLTSGNVLNWKPASVSQVPLPAAVWLFGSSLLGMLGFNRRKSPIVAA